MLRAVLACLASCVAAAVAANSLPVEPVAFGGSMRLHSFTHPNGCIYALDGGCAGSPGGQIMLAGGLDQWRESGQTWAAGYQNNHFWNWNQCGIDFACGHVTPTSSERDPAVVYASTTLNPTQCAAFSTFWPAAGDGVSYCATGGPTGGPVLIIKPQTADIALAQLNLSGNARTGFGHECVFVAIVRGSATHNVSASDIFFENDANCGGNLSSGANIFYVANGGYFKGDYTLASSTFLMHGAVSDCCSQGGAIANGTTNAPGMDFGVVSVNLAAGQNCTIEYVYVKSVPGHIYGCGGQSGAKTANVTLLYNLFDTIHTRAAHDHGEFGNIQWSSALEIGYSIGVSGADGCSCQNNLFSIDQNASQIDTGNFHHLLLVGNRAGGATIDHESVTASMTGGHWTISGTPSGPVIGGSFNGTGTAASQNLGGGVYATDCNSGGSSTECPTVDGQGHAVDVFNNTGGTASSGGFTINYTVGNALLAFRSTFVTITVDTVYGDPTGYTANSGAGSDPNAVGFIIRQGATCTTATIKDAWNIVAGAKITTLGDESYTPWAQNCAPSFI